MNLRVNQLKINFICLQFPTGRRTNRYNFENQTVELVEITPIAKNKKLTSRENSNGLKFPCHQCHRVYSRAHTLKRHLQFECGTEKKYSCKLCNHKSRRPDNLILHMKNVHQKNSKKSKLKKKTNFTPPSTESPAMMASTSSFELFSITGDIDPLDFLPEIKQEKFD